MLLAFCKYIRMWLARVALKDWFKPAFFVFEKITFVTSLRAMWHFHEYYVQCSTKSYKLGAIGFKYTRTKKLIWEYFLHGWDMHVAQQIIWRKKLEECDDIHNYIYILSRSVLFHKWHVVHVMNTVLQQEMQSTSRNTCWHFYENVHR